MKKKIFDQWKYYLTLSVLLVLAIIASIEIKKFIGYGTAVTTEAGTVTTVFVDNRQTASYWHGLYGLTFTESGFNETQTATLSAGEISSATFVFECISPNEVQQELYASTNDTIDFTNITAGSTSMIDDDFLNLTNDTTERANNTFTQNVSILVGTRNVSAIPAVYTYVNDAADNSYTFFTGILDASGKLVIVARLLQQSSTSFKGNNVRYQILLPIPNASTKFYFFADPNDECPAGFGTGQVGDAVITGYVFESNSTTAIANATISAGGNTSLTDSNGYYNITVPGNRDYDLLSIKEGYNTNITAVNTTIGATTYQNMTMSKFFGFTGPNATVSGYVKDNSTGSVIANATISIAGLTSSSNETGNYSLVIGQGNHLIAAVKSGYNNFVGNFSISVNQTISFLINMSQASTGADGGGSELNNGTIQGFVRDNSTNATLSSVVVTVAGVSNTTDSSGFYNITALQGVTNLVATKSGYNSFFSEVNITSNMTVLNFSMNLVTVSSGVGNGSIKGFVKDSDGASLSGVTVSVVGKSNSTNSTGEYLLQQIPAGTHVLVATKSDYVNNISIINITESQTTEHNITMIETTKAGLGAGSGAGSGAGQGAGSGAGQGAGLGAGRGAGTGVQAQIEQPTEIKDYEIAVKKILKKIKVGNFIAVPITISNNREDSMNLKFSSEGSIQEMLRMDKESLILEGNSEGEVTITLLGNVEPGVYEGNFIISGDINEKVPIYVLVLEKERLSVEALVIKITPERRKIAAGNELKFRVDLQNLLSEEKYKIDLSYSIEGITNNRSIFIEKEDVVILTSFSLLKKVDLPADLEKGDYSLKVKAEFLDFVSEQSTIFTVTEPIYKYALFGIIPMWIIFLLVGLLSTGTFSVMVYKKRKAEKQRYQIELDYTQLPKAGPRAAYVGNVAESRNKTYFDLDLFQVHTLIAGSSGSGKSIAAQVLVEEALIKGASAIVFDPTAQWTGFLRKCQEPKILSMYPKFNLKKTDARAFNGNIYQVENARESIDFKKIMKPGEINIFVTNKLETKDIELFVANTIREIFHSNLPENRELKYLLIYDGIHSLLPKFGGSGQVFVQIERATREFRKWGVGLVLISQVISDFPPEVLANINTEVQMRTRDEGDLNRTKEEYGDKILQSVVKAAVGTGVVENSAYNKGKPYFVAFRPILHNPQRVSDKELENYNKYNKIIDDIDYQLEQLEKEGIDVFDLRLELKLAQDKVKLGSFNMVDIYLDGLKPRISSQWEKLGKKPQKREIKYISDTELEKELQKTKVEREKRKEEGAVEETIKKAKEAAKSAEEDNKVKNTEDKIREKDKAQNGADNADDTVDSLIKGIKIDLEKRNKQGLMSSYSKLQSIYKTASKDDKIKIMQASALIRNGLSGK